MQSPEPRPLDLAVAAATTIAWTAVPDYVEGRTAQRLARAAVAAAGAGALRLTRDARQAPWERAADDPAGADEPTATGGGPGQAALVVGSVLALPAAVVGATRLEERAVTALRRRGVRRPRTVVGVGWALVGLAGSLGRSARPAPGAHRRP